MVKNLLANTGAARDTGSILESGRSPGRRNGNPVWYSCLENPMDRGGWWATTHSITKSRTRLKRPSTQAWEYRETKAARVHRTEYQRRENCAENFTDLQRKCS